MIKAFETSFKLRNSYRTNGVIYSIKQLPFIKKIIPDSLYNNQELKSFINVVVALLEFIGIFVAKFIYVYLLILLPSTMSSNPNNMIHISLFLIINGLLFNTSLFNPTKDKFYAIFLLKMDAKKYVLIDYAYFCLKILIGQIFANLILFRNINPIILILLPILTIILKTIYNSYILKKYEKKNVLVNENKPGPVIWTLAFINLALAYGLVYLNISVNVIIFYIIFVISLIVFFKALKYMLNFPFYREIYKKLLTNDNVIFDIKNYQTEFNKNAYLDTITYDEYKSNKIGYQYFNEVFNSRHKKLLTKSAKNIVVGFLIAAIIANVLAYFNQKFSMEANKVILNFLPYFTFIMYLINRGPSVTQAMFMNCDHSMLSYKFYKKPETILSLFKERLKTLIKINLLPALVIGIGLAILLFISGGTSNTLNYFVIFLSIVAMSIFFSIHNLVIYYLLQPYNALVEIKSSTYFIVSYLTYGVVWFLIQLQMPTLLFGLIVIIFTIVYAVVSLFLIYKFAARTFKLRN